VLTSPAYAAVVSESVTFSIAEGRQPVPTHIAKTGAERRRTRRFVLEIPVLFRWMDDRQTACEGAGFCRDISTGGVFVVASCAVPPLARSLELMVLLPPFNPQGPAMRLYSTGSVVRVEPVGEAMGLGIASTFGSFDDSEASSFPEKKTPSPAPRGR
jgi:PilZ domain